MRTITKVMAGIVALNCFACKQESDNFVGVTLIEGAVTMKVPPAWTKREVPLNSCDDIGEAYFGRGQVPEIGVAGVFIDGFGVTMKRRPYQQIATIAKAETAVIRAKMQNPAKAAVVLNEQENSLTVDCTASFYEEDAVPFFYRSKLIIQGDEWVRFYFRGVDSPALRRTIEQVTQTVDVHASPVMKRRKPCREIEI